MGVAMAGVDVGVKGAVWYQHPAIDQPKFFAYDTTNARPDEDELLRAIWRGNTIADELVRNMTANTMLIFDRPIWMGRQGARHGAQCALFGALVANIQRRLTSDVHVIRGAEARAALDITTKGKQGIVDWAESNREWKFLMKTTTERWKREALAEAFMLMTAASTRGVVS